MKQKIVRLTLFAIAVFIVLAGVVTAQTNIEVFRNIRVRNNATILGNLTVDGTATLSGGQTGAVDLNGEELTLDADADTSITADTDDQIDIEVSGADDFVITANLFESQTGSVVDLNGTKLELDADADTSLTADTDDTVHLEIGGSDIYTVTASIFDFNGKQLDLDVDDDTSITASTDDQLDFEIGGADEVVLTAATLDLNNTYIDQDIATENIMLPTVASTAFTYTAAAGGTATLFTIADGEIWLVHDIYVNVTTNFDATGDDATIDVGDGADVDGLCNLDDAELQTTDVEVTGSAAGWQCFGGADTIGAYIASGRGFIYAPSGAAETIDAVIAATGDDLSAGGATAYIVYTRIQ
jgi:hypothetical protein